MLFVKDSGLRFVDASSAFCEALGITREALAGKTAEELGLDLDAQSLRVDREVIQTGEPRRSVIESYGGACGKRLYATDRSPVKDAAGAVVGLACTCIDITDRVELQEHVLRIRDHARILADATSEHIVLHDTRQRVQWANSAAADSVQRTPRELVGRPCYEIWPQRSTPCEGCPVRLAIETGRSHRAEVAMPGHKRWLVSGSPVVDSNGVVTGAIEIALDATPNKELQRMQETLSLLANNVADIVWIMDLELRGTYVSPSIERVLGFTPDERLRQTIDEGLTPESMRIVRETLQRELELEASGTADPDRTITINVEYFRKDGSTIWTENVVTGLRDADGGLIGVLGVARDITERRRAEEQLRLRGALLDNVYDGVYVVSTDGHILYANHGAEEMTGFTAAELTSMNMMDLNAPECAVQVPARIEAMRERGDLAFETKHITRNGGTIDVEVRTRTFDTDGQTLFLSVARDTTERKRIEEALRESEEEKHIILESTNELVVLQDTNHRIVWANQSAANAVGMEMDALIGQYCYKAWADRDSPCEDCPALDAISTGTDQQRERTDPQGRYWLASASPVFEQDGALSGVVTVTLDVTAQKMAEQELRRVQQEQQLVLDTTRELIVFHTPDLRVIWANSASAESVGQEVRDLVGKHCYEIWAGRDSPCPDCPVLTSLSTGKPETAEQRTLDGRHWMLSANVARNETGEIVGAVEVGTDITARVLAEQAVRETEEKYHSLVESINDVVYSVDSDGRVAFISPQVEHLSGIPPAAIVGRHFTDFVHPDDLPALLQSWERLRQGIMEPSEFRVFDVAGTLRHVRSSSRPHFDDGRFVGATCSMVEITERVEAERELRESEEHFRALFEQSIAPMILTHPDGRILEVNEAWISLFGYSRTDTEALDVSETYAAPEDRARLIEALARADHVVDQDVRLKRKDGVVLTCVRSVTAQRAPDGRTLYFQSVIRDVTAQREAERQARESSELLRRGEQLSLTGGWAYDVATDTLIWTLGCYAIHELEPDTAMPLMETSVNCYAPDSRQELLKAFRRAAREGVPYLREADFTTVKGKKRRIRTIGVPEMHDGKVVRVVGTIADMTEQHQAGTALRESEARFRALFELSMDPTCIATPEGTLIDANHAWLNLFGYTRQDFREIKAHEIHLSPDIREELVHRASTMGTIHDEEIRLRKKDGTVIDCLHSLVARKDSAGRVIEIQSVVRDVTEKKKAEQILRESEERFRTLSENLDDAVVRMDRDFRLLYANPAMERVSGGSNGQFLAQLMDDSPESSQMMRDLRRDIQVVFDTGQPVSSGGEISLTDGVRVLGWSIAPERDLRGDVTTAIVSIHDVTDLRRAQEEAKESEARLRELAGYLQDATEKERTAIARDLHDHLGQGLTALRFDLAAVRNRINKDTGEARTAIENAIQMVDGLAADVRRLSSELRPGMLDDLGLCAAIEWHVGQFSERTGVACEISLPEDDSGIDSRVNTAAYRVLQELLTNVARHADATRVTIHMKREHGALSLTVRDNGRGISKRQLRSKESLGILGMRERIKSLGGDLTISGERGKGTTATVKIPIECPSRDEGLRSGK